MASRPSAVDPAILAYVRAHGTREPAPLARLRAETAPLRWSAMQIGADQAALLALLTELLPVGRYLEVGTFTGYSALAVALAMAPDGSCTCLDVSREWTDIARRHWDAAGVGGRIELRLAPAADSLDALLAEGRAGSYDLAFLDADKAGYPLYYEKALELVRAGGLVALDNTFLGGRVLDPDSHGEDAPIVDALNRRIRDDDRVTPAMLSVGDGLTLCRKR